MKIRENIMISVQNIRRNRLRSFLTILSIVLGVAFCIMLFSTGNAGAAYVDKEFESVGEKSIRITVSPLAAAAEHVTFEDVKLMKEKIKGVSYASPFMRLQGEIRSLDAEEKGAAEIVAGNQDLQYVFGNSISTGRYFTEDEFENARQVALLNESAAKKVFGFENIVGQTVEITVDAKRIRLTIVGLLQEKDADPEICLTMPATTLLNMIGGEERVDTCYLVAEDKQAMADTGDFAEHFLGIRHNNLENNSYRSANAAQHAEMMGRVQALVNALVSVMAGIALILGGIGVMGIMLLSVTQRAKEIGIRKALGAKTRTVLGQFLMEAVILCLVGGLLGCAAGAVGSWILSSLLGLTVTFSWLAFLLPILFALIIGFIFGLAPARKAAMLPPMEALRRD